jgi:hypothetical protein
MAVSYTTTDLLARIKRTAQLADVNLKLTDAELIQIADEAIQSRLWPELRASIEEYATTHNYVTFPAESDSPVQSGMMRLPSRASGSTIVAVYQVLTGGDVRPVTRIDISEAQRFGDVIYGGQRTGPKPRYYALTGDYIKILPAASETVTLRVIYERRPSRLCAVSDAAEIVSWNSGTNVFTTTNVPSSWTTATVLDIVRHAQQATDPVVDNAEVDAVADPLITLNFGDTIVGSEAVYATVSPGDYICEAGTTCVFPLPDNWYAVAVLAAASDALLQCGYTDEAMAIVPQTEAKISLAIRHNASRVRKQPKAIFDRDSPLRTGGWGTWGRWGNER